MIENELTFEQIARQKKLIEEDIKNEEAQIGYEIEEKQKSATADRILSQTVGSAKTFARKFLTIEGDIKLSNSPQLISPDNLGILLNLFSNGSIKEIKRLCKTYEIDVPSSITLRPEIGEHIRTKLGEKNVKDSKHLLAKFVIGGSGGWTAFTA